MRVAGWVYGGAKAWEETSGPNSYGERAEARHGADRTGGARMTGPERASGLSRVVIACSPENFDATLKGFAETLGIGDFDEPFVAKGMGLRVAASWSAGIELIAPHGDEGHAPALRAHIAARGEGVYNVVYAVPALEAAVARAEAAGHAPPRGERIDCLAIQPAWRRLFANAREAPLQPLGGVSLTLIELEPRQD